MSLKILEINPLFNLSERFQADVERLDNLQKSLFAGGIVPTIRRVGSVPDSLQQSDFEKAALTAVLAGANLPSDYTQMVLAKRETADMIKNNFRNFGQINHQRNIHLIRGTFLDKHFSREWLDRFDKTLFDTKLGAVIRDFFNINPNQNVKILPEIFKNSKDVKLRIVEGNSLQRLLGNSMLRIPVLGIGVAAGLEAPAIIKSAVNSEGTFAERAGAVGLQLGKSAAFIGLTTAAIAVGGAAFKRYGILAEFAGMAIGSVASIMASKKINEKFDNLTNKKETSTESERVNPFSELA